MEALPINPLGEQKYSETVSIPGNWDVQTKKLIEKYPQLTDADLKHEYGKESELLTRLETRLNKNRDEEADIIRNI